MRVAAWLAWRELGTRTGRLALAGAVVAAAVALCVGSEMVDRAREGAVAGRIDRIGPPLRVVPAGVTAGALARLHLGGRLLPAGLEAEARRAVPGLRHLEARLVLEGTVAGRSAPLVGVPAQGLDDGLVLRPGHVALGPALAAQVGARPGDEVPVGGERWRVAAVLPSAASADDAAAWAPLGALQATVFDLPQALDLARETIAAERMGERVSVQEGDFWRDDLGREYDAALLFNVVHGSQPDANAELLRKVAAALRPGGRIVILDQMKGRLFGATSKAVAALNGLVLFNFAGGRTYAYAEIAGWLGSAGFAGPRRIDLLRLPGCSLVTAAKIAPA